MSHNQTEEAKRDWAFARSETMELLDRLDDARLAFRPKGDKWQSLAYQFACIGRTQLVYAKALKTGVMDFAYFADASLPDKQKQKTDADVHALLARANETWLKAVEHGEDSVQWPSGEISKEAHIYRLIAHERLHHGIMIAYFTMANFTLPSRFKQNWAL